MCRSSPEFTVELVVLLVFKLAFPAVAEFGEVVDPIVALELFVVVVGGVLFTAFELLVLDLIFALASSLLPQPFTSLCLCS